MLAVLLIGVCFTPMYHSISHQDAGVKKTTGELKYDFALKIQDPSLRLRSIQDDGMGGLG